MNQTLYDNLRAWRNEKAFAEGKQPFMIFNNATIKTTADNPPESISDLSKIKGWGPAKIHKYGQEIISLIQKIKTSHDKKNDTDEITQSEDKVNDILTVELCIQLLNKHLNELTILKIQGELHDINIRDRYAFFNLKDTNRDSTISCFIGWALFDRYKHVLTEGTEVVVAGSPSIYKNGKLSIEIKRIEPIGDGALKKAFELLKKNLQELGYFDPKRKRPIPINPTSIAVITSIHGAAINDFKKNLKPYGFKLYASHVFVEGENAVESICNAITKINLKHTHIELIVLIRGGGGLENLKAFNDKSLAEKIIQSRIPIITGIGHEKDISIADLCADSFYSTPTAVAQALNNTKDNLSYKINEQQNKLLIHGEHHKKNHYHKIDIITQQIIRYTHNNLHSNKKDILSKINTLLLFRFNFIEKYIVIKEKFLEKATRYQINIKYKTESLKNVQEKITRSIHNKITIGTAQISSYEQQIQLLNPNRFLEKGYGIVYDENGNVIRGVHECDTGDSITIRLHNGKIISTIQQIKKKI